MRATTSGGKAIRAGALLAAVAFAAAGCSILEPREDPTRFFVLTASVDATASAPGGAAPASDPKSSIGLGPVTLPAYLERPEIVRRSAEHELVPSRADRWGEPLDAAVQRVLAQDLAQITGRRVVAYPWKTALAPGAAVAVDVTRFEPVEGQRVELAADVDGASFRRQERIEVPLPATDGGAVAKAMSEALAELARRIAAALGGGSGGR